MAELITTPEQAEQQMATVVTTVEQTATDLVVDSDDRYAQAGALLTRIKGQQKAVTEFFEPMRLSTKAAYDSVLKRKKDMTAPLEKAEKIIKGKMGAYQQKIEADRRAQEAAQRRLAEAAREKAFTAAVEAESKGDTLGAEAAMLEAEILDDAAAVTFVGVAAPKAAGISKRTTWKITAIEADKVPVAVAGVVIRPVDEKAVMALIKASKGTVRIPGITFEEDYIISARA